MSWAKIDDQFFTNPKVIELSKDAKLLYLSALTYCTGQLTDGIITPGALRVIAATVDVSRDEAAALMSAGLWEAHENGWLIHDYHAYNPTADVAKTHKQNVSQIRSEAGSKGAASRWQSTKDDDSKAHGKRDSKAHSKTMAQSDPNPNPNPNPNPIPEEGPGNKNYQGAASPTGGNAVKIFIDLFTAKRGEPPDIPPRFTKALAETLARVKEPKYRAAIAGFLVDDFGSERGCNVETFVGRPVDRWIGAKPQQGYKNGSNGSETSAFATGSAERAARFSAIRQNIDREGK